MLGSVKICNVLNCAFTLLNIAAVNCFNNWFKFEFVKQLTLFYKISTDYSCEITDCLSV